MIRGLVAIATLALLAACAEPQISPLTAGSQWRVAAVDGAWPGGDDLIVTFLADTATLSSRCGASIGSAITGPDGAATFGTFEGPQGEPVCPDIALDAHRRVADALAGVTRWQLVGARVELDGAQVIQLESQRTDT